MRINGETASKAFVRLYDDVEPSENPLVDFPAEQDETIILSHLQFAEKLFPASALTLCPISHAKMQYYSQSCEKILGHPHSKLTSMTLADFFGLVHPDDLPSLQQCFMFLKHQKSVDPETHRYSIYYRIRNSEGDYVPIKNDQLVIRIRENSYLYLMMYSNVAREEKFYHVKLDVYKNVNGNYIKIDTYNPQQQEKAITPRQNDIATLVTRGFSNREIAEQLGISIYTVKNHKQMLFRKVSVKNSIELANYVQSK